MHDYFNNKLLKKKNLIKKQIENKPKKIVVKRMRWLSSVHFYCSTISSNWHNELITQIFTFFANAAEWAFLHTSWRVHCKAKGKMSEKNANRCRLYHSHLSAKTNIHHAYGLNTEHIPSTPLFWPLHFDSTTLFHKIKCSIDPRRLKEYLTHFFPFSYVSIYLHVFTTFSHNTFV